MKKIDWIFLLLLLFCIIGVILTEDDWIGYIFSYLIK